MKLIKFLVSLFITFCFIFLLNTRFAPAPPLGKFLDPFHGFWQNAEPLSPNWQAELAFEKLQGQATVRFDSLLIPHIEADNEKDLYFLQGYYSAKLRLWQMEFQTHVAAGRVSEIVGSMGGGAIAFDREKRRRGMVFAAENFVKAMESDPISKRVIEAFSDGVNAYIESLDYGSLPFEYKLLNYEPEAWNPLKCALLLKLMADDLSGSDRDLAYTNALHTFGKDTFDLLYPDMLPMQDPVVDKAGAWGFKPVSFDSLSVDFPLVLSKKLSVHSPNPDNGSNNWAVSGAKTVSGYPILCNDPHLGLKLPSIWLAMHLKAPGVNVMGVTIPGAPGIIVGFNEKIAWGVTNARRDVVDWYKVRFKDASRSYYWLDSSWVATAKKVEKITSREGEIVYDTVAYTQWGPVVYDDTFRSTYEESGFALRWVAHDPSLEVKALYDLNRAQNFSEYRKAITNFSSPGQNFVFASTQNDIGITVQGKYPLKWEGQGKFAMDGSRSELGWQGFIPPEHNVFSKNPVRGFVSSANQHPADSTYPYYDFDHTFEYYRNRRINRVLESIKMITVEEMQRLQNDNYNLFAAESLPFLLAQLPDSILTREEKKASQLLARWNFFNDPDEEAASYFEAWWDMLYPMIWDEMEGGLYMKKPNKTVTLHLMQSDSVLRFFDIQETEEVETREKVVYQAFKKALEHVQKWKVEKLEETADWATYKATRVTHLLNQDPLSVFNLKNGGNHNIVNATSQGHGPSWRMVVSLKPDNVEAWGIYPGGQSGNPGSPHYIDLLSQWEEGSYQKLSFPLKEEDVMFEQKVAFE